jgi:uncharacterized caspase-like protein
MTTLYVSWAMLAGLAAPAGPAQFSSTSNVMGIPPPSTANPRFHVLSIGINDYAEPRMNIRFAVKDSQGFMETYANAVDPVASKRQLSNPTASQIREALAEVGKSTSPTDTFVFFFAGTGNEEHVGILGSDFSLPSDARAHPGVIKAKELAALFRQAACSNVLAIFDACYSGKFIDEIHAETELLNSQFPSARHNLMMIGVSKLTFETKSSGSGAEGGVLTRAVLKAVTGASLGILEKEDSQLRSNELAVTLPSILHRVMKEPNVRRELGESEVNVTYRSSGNSFVVSNVIDGFAKLNGQGSARATRPMREMQDVVKSRNGKDYAFFFAFEAYDKKDENGKPLYKKLENPVKDARDIAAVLHDDYGFETIVHPDLSMKDFVKELDALVARSWKPHDQVFIYISGHGEYLKNADEGYTIFRDSGDAREMERVMPHSTLQKYLQNIPCRRVLLVLDQCFSGAFRQVPPQEGGFRGKIEAGKVIEELGRGVKSYLVSGGVELVSDGVPGQNSPFARAMLDALKKRATEEDPMLWLESLVGDMKDSTVRSGSRLKTRPGWGHMEPPDHGAAFLFMGMSSGNLIASRMKYK